MNADGKWAVNEMLLQGYRASFISSQAFLIAASSIAGLKSALVAFAIALLGMVIVWFIWYPVVRTRHLIVDYYKYSESMLPERKVELCSEVEYVHCGEKRSAANRLFEISTNWRATRLKMDIALPIIFTAIWVLLLVQSFSELWGEYCG